MATGYPPDVTNFVVFVLNDNDFHDSLQKAVRHIVHNQSEELSPEALKHFIVTGIKAFQSIKRIDNFGFQHRQEHDSTEYLNKSLQIKYVDQVTEEQGEGYVWNRYTDEVYYFGY